MATEIRSVKVIIISLRISVKPIGIVFKLQIDKFKLTWLIDFFADFVFMFCVYVLSLFLISRHLVATWAAKAAASFPTPPNRR